LRIVAAAGAVLVLGAVPILAQTTNQTANQPGTAQAAAPASSVRQARAFRAAEAPTIDGSLDERVWQDATPIDGFVQAEPAQGAPATERTEVKVLFDNQTIYIGVMNYDSDPSGIVTTDSRRDSNLQGQDSFQMIFDTYHDRQNGFIFGTNSVGIQYDAQVRNEGQTLRGGPPGGLGGGNAGGSGGGINTNWDGAWEVRTRVTEQGWSAEFAIPLGTLRYGPPPQVWGLNFARSIERKREDLYWSPVSRIYNIARLSSAGELRDLEVPAPRDFKLMPYVTSSANRNFLTGTETDVDGDWGIDGKIGVTSSLTLDLTYNTDFAQVEVDEQQINLTRFNLNFPEKRPFFLENRGLFAVGRPGEVDLFFSRAIGISDGDFVPIVGGARLSGTHGGLNIGLLNMQTDKVGCSDPGDDCLAGSNFTAARVSRDYSNRSSLGAIFVGRLGTGDAAGDDNWNRTWGLDGRLGIGEELTLSAFAARTETPGATRGEHSYSGNVEYRSQVFETSLGFTEVAEDFNPEVGFLERDDAYRQVTTTIRYRMRNEGLAGRGIREWEPHASYEAYWGFDGFLETATLHVDSRLDFESNYSIQSTALNVQFEGLRERFEVYPGVIVPAGSYTSPYFLVNASTDRRQWLSGGMNANIGGFLSGSQVSLAPNITIRDGARLNATFRWTRNDIDLPQGEFATNLITSRVTYNFTTTLNASTLVQYNDRTDRWSTNVRFQWLRTAATGLYVVYNDTEGLNGLGPINRAFIVKYTHLWDAFQ
jgi:hypothetical protein